MLICVLVAGMNPLPLTPATATARPLTEVLAGGADLMAAKARKGSNVTTPPHPTSRR